MEHIFLKQLNKNFLLLFTSMALGIIVMGCEENKTVQCEQIFQIARSVAESYQDISYAKGIESLEMKPWLQAASQLDSAAKSIKALNIDNSQLIQYQNQLATVYRIYSQATYDAVRARENKNLAALESARSDAYKAGKMQQSLIQEINAFCLDH
ncbi:MAG: hypothetical protein AAF298_09055 [Cyanobacteria bacterium P01_A01_bin.40]